MASRSLPSSASLLAVLSALLLWACAAVPSPALPPPCAPAAAPVRVQHAPAPDSQDLPDPGEARPSRFAQ